MNPHTPLHPPPLPVLGTKQGKKMAARPLGRGALWYVAAFLLFPALVLPVLGLLMVWASALAPRVEPYLDVLLVQVATPVALALLWNRHRRRADSRTGSGGGKQ